MKIAIVSTYKIDCGIARFTNILERDLSQDNEVTVIPMNRFELKEEFGGSRKSAENAIARMVEQLRDFDAVSIQYEYSLLGSTLPSSIERLKKIAVANPNTTITFHTVLNRAGRPQKNVFSLARMIRPRAFVSNWINTLRKNRPLQFEIDLFEFIKEKQVKIIVHTKTTRELLGHLFLLNKVYCHPLCYTRKQDRVELEHFKARSDLRSKYSIPEDVVTIGVFGYFGKYKGFDYAIKCLARLPEHYHLYIFAGLHPAAIKESDDSQISLLSALATKLKVVDRVSFLGAVDDDSMYRAIAGVDFSWLPYREVGQEASAICSEVAELSHRMLLSRNFAFSDYLTFGKRQEYELFEISNIEELRLKTVLYDSLHKCEEVSHGVEFAEEQARFYTKVLETKE